ncbi:MAG: YfhO family protein [Anaerolineae bacterium]
MTTSDKTESRLSPKPARWFRRYALPAALLALLCAAFFWDALWLPEGYALGGNDLTNMFVPWLHFVKTSIQQGRLPLWNPTLFSGTPFVANPQPALFYPPTWLALLLSPARALALSLVFHVWLAGVGMVVWMRSEAASETGAFLGAVVFAFSGYTFTRIQAGHVGLFNTGAWLPLILWMGKRAIGRRSWRWAILGGLPVGMAFLAGHTATFIYVGLTLALYLAFCAWRAAPDLRTILKILLPPLALMTVVGLGLGAIQLLPLAELTLHSNRQTVDYAFAARFSWPPGYVLTLLIPNFFGEPARTGYWGDGVYDEVIFYVGLLPLLLAALGARTRHRLTPFLVALGLGALLLALGQYGVLHPLFYRFVPLFSMMRAPARAGFLFTLAAAALAGLALTALNAAEERARLLGPLKWSWVWPVTGAAVLLAMVGFAAFAWGREANPAAGRLWHTANQIVLFVLLLIPATAWLRQAVAPGKRLLAGAAIVLALVDLWTFGGSIVTVKSAPENAYWRIVAHAIPDPQAARVLPWELGDFDQNGGMPYGLRSITGYDPLMLERYQAFIHSRNDPTARTFDLLNAGYLVTTAPQAFPDTPESPRLLHEESGVWIYERPTALPRAWVTTQTEVLDDARILARIHAADFDPRTTALMATPTTCASTGEPGQADVIGDTGNRIEARVQGGGGMLIFSEVDYPGWRAFVDGNAVPLIRADYVLRALCVPAGDHEVTLVYDPPLLKIGAGITGLTLLLLIGAIIALRRK